MELRTACNRAGYAVCSAQQRALSELAEEEFSRWEEGVLSSAYRFLERIGWCYRITLDCSGSAETQLRTLSYARRSELLRDAVSNVPLAELEHCSKRYFFSDPRRYSEADKAQWGREAAEKLIRARDRIQVVLDCIVRVGEKNIRLGDRAFLSSFIDLLQHCLCIDRFLCDTDKALSEQFFCAAGDIQRHPSYNCSHYWWLQPNPLVRAITAAEPLWLHYKIPSAFWPE